MKKQASIFMSIAIAFLISSMIITKVQAQQMCWGCLCKEYYNVYAEKKINDSITVQVVQKGTKKYWKIINSGYEKIVIGTKISHFYEKNIDGGGMLSGGRITEGDTLIKGQSKLYPIDFFSKESLYNKEFPNFVLAWENLDNPQRQTLCDYFVHFYDDHAPLGVKGKIGDWF